MNQRVVLGILTGFLLGLIIGRLARQNKEKKVSSRSREGNEAFFKGVQYILANEHDQAIEEFTKSVQVNSDTVETYVALGNLYRSKGDIDRAIRIRQSIILRPHIDEQIKLRALYDLGLDYRKGGFLNWALDTFLRVLQKQPGNLDTLKEIEKIYEEMKDWDNAFAYRQRISKLGRGDHEHILAHHQTEIGKVLLEQGDLSRAKSCFKKAVAIDEKCIDAYLHLGDLYFSKQDYKNAIATWKKVGKVSPRFTFLAYRRLEGAYTRMKNLKPVEEFLKECARSNSDAFTRVALARYLVNEQDYPGALRELEGALDLDPSFWEARRLMGEILLDRGMKDEALEAYRDLIPRLHFPYLKFQCTNCGFTPNDLLWQCPQCRTWDSVDFMDSAPAEPAFPQKPQVSLPEIPPEPPEDDA
ncbi:MAG: tetratricopeptide repeat protein [Deltaproteobacteria bacterium]|nr:tetratricopeptide repeat protein [Deltaproteobacteria bacterium]